MINDTPWRLLSFLLMGKGMMVCDDDRYRGKSERGT